MEINDAKGFSFISCDERDAWDLDLNQLISNDPRMISISYAGDLMAWQYL